MGITHRVQQERVQDIQTMIGGIKKIGEFVRKETVLTVALLLAVISAFIVPPDIAYADYIDFRTLAILFCLITAGNVWHHSEKHDKSYGFAPGGDICIDIHVLLFQHVYHK